MSKLRVYGIFLVILVVSSQISYSQSAGDYRSIASGPWVGNYTWEKYEASQWTSTVIPPTSSDGTITIRDGHKVSTTDSRTVDQIVVASGGTLEVYTSTLTVADGDGTDLEVNGTLTITGGILDMNGSLVLNGTSSIDGGTLRIDGTLSVPSGASVNVESYLTVNGTATIEGSSYLKTGGTLDGSGQVQISNGASLDWSGGSLSTTSTTVNSGGTLIISGSENKTFRSSAGHIYNYGTIRWTGTGYIRGSDSEIQNYEGALFDIQNDAKMEYDIGGGSYFDLVNAGTIRKTAGAGTFDFDYVKITNSGTVESQSGIISCDEGGTHTGTFTASSDAAITFNGGTHTVAEGVAFTGAGSINLSDGAMTVSGTTNGATMASGLTFNYTGGLLEGSGKLTVNGIMNWSGDGEYRLANTTIASGAVLNIIGSTDRKFRSTSGPISNDGTINWTGSGKIRGSDKSIQNNSGGVINISVNAIYEYDGGGGSGLTFTNNGTINMGTYTLSGASTFTNNGTMTIGSPEGIAASGSAGSIQTDTRTFNSSGNYTYNGSSAQVTGSGLPSTVNNLTVNNSNGLTLTSGVGVNGTLTLTGGNLSTGSNTLTLGSSAVSVGTLTRTGGAIVGNFKRWIAASTANDILFPLGNGSDYRAANISFTGAPSEGGTITASFTASDPGTSGLSLEDGGTIINKLSPAGYWTLTAADGLSGGTYSLDLTGENIGGVSNYQALRIVKRINSESAWTLEGTHSAGTGSNSIPIVHRTGLTDFSDFAIGSNENDNSLPVSLTSFNAVCNSGKIVLTWRTESETENLGFIIQRKIVGANHDLPSSWSQIASYTTNNALSGHGSTSEAHEYAYTDAAVIPDAPYLYRLGDVDYSGAVTWHGEVEVKVKAEVEQMPVVFGLKPAYPNPFNPSLTIPYGLTEDGNMSLKVYNLRGELVKVLKSTYALKGTYSYNWNPVNLSAGIYIIRMQAGNQTSMQKVVFVK